MSLNRPSPSFAEVRGNPEAEQRGWAEQLPALRPIDLRGRLRQIHVQAKGSDGRELYSSELWVMPPKGALVDPELRIFSVRELLGFEVTLVDAVNLLIRDEDYRDLYLFDVSSDVDVVLEPAIQVQLYLDGLPEILGRADFEVEYQSPMARYWMWLDEKVGEDGSLRLSLGSPGAWKMRLLFIHHDNGFSTSSTFPLPDLQVRDEDGVQVHRVRLEPDFMGAPVRSK